MKKLLFILLAAGLLVACNNGPVPPDPDPDDTTKVPVDTSKVPVDTTTVPVDTTTTPPDTSSLQGLRIVSTLTHVQPMTGLVLWPDQARSKDATFNQSISLEYSYCLPNKVVTGKQGDQIQYDWTWFENLLDDIASRNHQAIVRFRYEYPNGSDAGGPRGSTAVPQYIKDRSDYNETYSANPGGDGPTYYADWSNTELQWFTKQFYTDFAARYGNDPRIAFLEVGFGHWAEYHIYGTPLRLGVNFPSKPYQREFLLHVANVMPIPWLISIDAADDSYTPIVGSSELMALTFGTFDDSFMHQNHEGGYNEECWQALGQGKRWKTGVCGGEISYYSSRDQRGFLNPAGLYGHTWEEQAAKYHITFMIANDAPGTTYGTPERFLEAGLASGYRLKVTSAQVLPSCTRVRVTNAGVAPVYKEVYFAIDNTRSTESLRGLQPGETREVTVDVPLTSSSQRLHVVSDAILPTQTIEFEADIRL